MGYTCSACSKTVWRCPSLRRFQNHLKPSTSSRTIHSTSSGRHFCKPWLGTEVFKNISSSSLPSTSLEWIVQTLDSNQHPQGPVCLQQASFWHHIFAFSVAEDNWHHTSRHRGGPSQSRWHDHHWWKRWKASPEPWSCPAETWKQRPKGKSWKMSILPGRSHFLLFQNWQGRAAKNPKKRLMQFCKQRSLRTKLNSVLSWDYWTTITSS